MENTTPDNIQVGYTLKWKLLLGFAISTFVIIVIALVTIGVITNGSFVFENSQSPTLAPTKAPTLAPITSPPTMTPITSPPTFNPTFAPTPSPTMTPITSPPTFNPTFAPTPSPTMTSQPTMTPITSPPTFNPTFAPTPSPTSSPTAAPTSTPINVCSSPYNLPGPYSGSTLEIKWADNDYFVSLEANVFMKPSLSTQGNTGDAYIMMLSNEFARNPPYTSIIIYCSNYSLRCQYVDNLNNYHNLSNTLNILPNNEYNVLFYLDSNRILLKVTNVLTSESITNQIYEPTGFTSTNDISKQNKLDIGVEDAASSKVIVSNIKLCGAVPTLAPTTAAPTPTLAPTQSTKIGIYSGCYDIAYMYWKTNKWLGSTNDWGECNGVFPQGESYNYSTQDAFFAKYRSDPSIPMPIQAEVIGASVGAGSS